MAGSVSEKEVLLPPFPGASLDDLLKEVQLAKDCDLDLGGLPVIYLACLIQSVFKGLKTKEEQLHFALTESARFLEPKASPHEQWWTCERLLALEKLRDVRPYPMYPRLKERVGELAKTFGEDARVEYNCTGRWLRGVTLGKPFGRLPAETRLGPIVATLVNQGRTLLLRPSSEH